MNIVVAIIREITKLAMFTGIWGFPLYVARLMDNNYYLFLLVLSFFVNMGMFAHYELLEKIDSLKGKEEK